MGRLKINDDEKKIKVSVALEPELLKFYRSLHINLSSLVNKLMLNKLLSIKISL